MLAQSNRARERKMGFRDMLNRTVKLINLPFGFTLTIWSSGAMAAYRYGLPNPPQALLFVSGAVGGYLVCAALSAHEQDSRVEIHIHNLALANVFAIVAAAVGGIVPALIGQAEIGYTATGFVGTVCYIACVSAMAQLAYALRRRENAYHQSSASAALSPVQSQLGPGG
jgi:hypothetical protein